MEAKQKDTLLLRLTVEHLLKTKDLKANDFMVLMFEMNNFEFKYGEMNLIKELEGFLESIKK